MNMKKIMMTMLALLCMTVASAQQTVTSSRQPRQFDATTQTSLMAEKLGLSSDQKTKVEALNKEYAELFTRPQSAAPRREAALQANVLSSPMSRKPR